MIRLSSTLHTPPTRFFVGDGREFPTVHQAKAARAWPVVLRREGWPDYVVTAEMAELEDEIISLIQHHQQSLLPDTHHHRVRWRKEFQELDSRYQALDQDVNNDYYQFLQSQHDRSDLPSTV